VSVAWAFTKYDIAQICLNGHVINDSTYQFPEGNKKFCQRCGKPTIVSCQDCGCPIRGNYIAVVDPASHYTAPAYCEDCGEPYPWTERH
jgi:hypothetical protein